MSNRKKVRTVRQKASLDSKVNAIDAANLLDPERRIVADRRTLRRMDNRVRLVESGQLPHVHGPECISSRHADA